MLVAIVSMTKFCVVIVPPRQPTSTRSVDARIHIELVNIQLELNCDPHILAVVVLDHDRLSTPEVKQ